METSGDPFPSDWSPPPIEFLNPRPPQDAQGRRWGGVGTSAEGSEPQHADGDLKAGPASPEELFCSLACQSQQADVPEPSAHGLCSPPDSGNYVNSLDCLLQEKREQPPEQGLGSLFLQHSDALPCSEDSEDEDEDALLTPQHRLLVEKFAVSLQDIPQVHPGESVFLPRRYPLPCFLDASQLKPHSALEELFLNAPPSQQLFFLRSSLLSTLYLHSTRPCPVPVLQWLLKLLAWPPDTSSRAFGLLWDLSVDELFHQSGDTHGIGGLGPQPLEDSPAEPLPPASPEPSAGPADEDVRPWCPSLQEVMELLHSLGAHSPTAYLPGPCSRTLDGGDKEQQDPPQETALDMCLSNIYKFLTLCVYVRPGVYTDATLLGLTELLCRTGLDVGLRLLPKTNLQQLLLQLLECVREWPGKLQRLCRALSWVSDHHHNLLAVVQLFPDVTPRGRQLRSQLSLSVIARMLGQEEALPLWKEKSQLSLLSRLLGLMKPSALRQHLGFQPSTPCQEQWPKASAELDHKVCYLCHSLLTLAGVVVSSQDVTPEHWGELQLLCMQLDRHINTHIRESPQAMHRTRLKDLATQTYIRWQELLAHCQPKAKYFRPWKDL
ncbi:PREDICTED: protein FAM178B isoform X1 [Chinchilla lanigera]|uniref:protein FAM178B isoform X1 n=2 Tax=Chinchilla lanigera TaxID=34839 RepID=UPI00038F12A9|nr:PREDICTED: protein FAM178B isoform X1 [Chinchilla lanigera]